MTHHIPERGITILIADDDPVVRETFCSLLGERGYEVLTAANGQAAVEEAMLSSPDLIFLDVIMPEMDGFETLEQLRKMRKTRRIPVIIVTARTDIETLLKALKMGASDFISKPFLHGDLFRKMNFALLTRQQQQQATEESLISDESTFVSGESFERMRENFVLNFENVYVSLLRLISDHRQEELKVFLNRLMNTVKFYRIKGVKEKLLQMLLAIKTDEWDKALDILEAVFGLFQDLRRTLPGTNRERLA